MNEWKLLILIMSHSLFFAPLLGNVYTLNYRIFQLFTLKKMVSQYEKFKLLSTNFPTLRKETNAVNQMYIQIGEKR